MSAKLLCIEGSLSGKAVIFDENEPRKIRIGAQASAPILLFSFERECWHVSSDQDIQLNGDVKRASILHGGDEIHCNNNIFRFESDEIISVDYMAETDEESMEMDEIETADGRSRRRISASHKAVIQSPSSDKPGIFERMGQAFRRKDERLGKLDELESQRQAVIEEAGRYTLEQQGGLGLPKDFLAKLFQGETLSLSLKDLNVTHAEHFRHLRERLMFLDADIDVCRIEAGLPPEDRNQLHRLHLRSDHEAEEENAFQAMDAVPTVEQEMDLFSASEDQQLDVLSDHIEEEVLSEGDDQTDIIERPAAANDEKDAQRSRSSSRRRATGVVRRRRRTR